MRCMGYPACSKSAWWSDRNTNSIIWFGEDHHSTCMHIKHEFFPLLIFKSTKISNISLSSVLRLLPFLVSLFSINCLLSQKVIFKLVFLFFSNRATLICDVQVTLLFRCIQTFSILHNSHEATQHTLPYYPILLPLLHTSFSNKLGLIKERTDTACFKTGDRRLMEKDKRGGDCAWEH